MAAKMTREWVSMGCADERDRRACLSWFPIVPADWGLPIKAEVQVEIATDRETAIRALFRTESGRLKQAVRRINQRTFTIRLSDASPAILRDFTDPLSAAQAGRAV